MELYGIVGAATRKTTPNGKELLEVIFYSLDIETAEGKNQIVQVAFWDNLERNEKLVTKGSRMRIFIDKIKSNPQIDKNGNPVVYLNANGYGFTYVTTGGGNQNQSGNGQSGNQQNNQNKGNNGYNQGQNQNAHNNSNQNRNQGNQQGYNNNTQSNKPQDDQMSDIESFLGSI